MTSLLTGATPTPADQGAQNTGATNQGAADQKPAQDQKPVDQKPAETGKPADQKPADKPADKPAKAPERYELSTPKGMPEGHQIDETVLGSFTEVARELNLSNESAQKLLDKVLPVIQQRAVEQSEALHTQWRDAVKVDKEIGGQKLDENLATAKAALKAYGNDGLQQLMNGPIGSHPDMLKFLVKVGARVAPDKFVERDVTTGDTESETARKLYPKSS